MERDVNPVVAEAQHLRDSTGRAGLKVHTSGELGSPSQAVLPLHKTPAHYIECSCHCHMLQLQGVSPTPA